MEHVSAPSAGPRRHRRSRNITLALLAALTTLALVGCPGPTPIRKLRFPDPVPMQTLTVSEDVSLDLPSAAGGSGKLAYRLSPEIPGLTFDPETRTLTGTPTEPGEHDMTYGVTDQKDNSVELTFHISVIPFTLLKPIVSAITTDGHRHAEIRLRAGTERRAWRRGEREPRVRGRRHVLPRHRVRLFYRQAAAVVSRGGLRVLRSRRGRHRLRTPAGRVHTLRTAGRTAEPVPRRGGGGYLRSGRYG